MKRLLWVLAGIVGLGVLVVGVGALLPQGHVASRAAQYAQPLDAIWQAITDYEKFTAWRPGVTSVKPLPEREGRTAWVETSDFGDMPLEVTAAEAPRRLVTRIAHPNLPFGGTWTYELTPTAGGTVLRITENGEIYNPFFRFMSRFVFGHTATIEEYLKALGKKFGEEVAVMP